MHSRDPHGLDPAVQADLSDSRRRLTDLQDGARDAGLIVPRERPSFTRVVNEVLSLDETATSPQSPSRATRRWHTPSP